MHKEYSNVEGVALTALNTLVRSPAFWIGVFCKFLILYYFHQGPAREWYIPFMQATANSFSLDPWNVWRELDGDMFAFPYGMGMWFFLLVPFWIDSQISLAGDLIYFFTLFCVDLSLVILISKICVSKPTLVLPLYWCSPVVCLATYGYGYNDIVPAFLLCCSIYLLQVKSWELSAIALAVCLATKLSMALAFPIFLLYFMNRPALLKFSRRYFLTFGFTSLVIQGPFFWSGTAFEALIRNPDFTKLNQSFVSVGGMPLLILPFGYVLFLYWIWRGRRISFRMFLSYCGITFLALAILYPDEAGWFVWASPFLVLYQLNSGKVAIWLAGVYGSLLSIFIVITDPVISKQLLEINWPFELQVWSLNNQLLVQMLLTLTTLVGVLLIVRQLRESIFENPFFRETRRPFVVGIAGDSGTGKDTLASSLIELIGAHSALNISGDDYHKYNRSNSVWKFTTHLNPAANNLGKLISDLADLRNEKPIFKRRYDHQLGTISASEQVKPKHFLISSGLHTFYFARLRELFDLRIFLDMDEDLRRALKIKRDTTERKKSEADTINAINDRKADSERFIFLQEDHAHIVFSLTPETKINSFKNQLPKLMLRVRMAASGDEELLERALVGICGCEITKADDERPGFIKLQISGDLASEDIEMAAHYVCPRVDELTDIPVSWQSGMLGVMQIIVMFHIFGHMQKRVQNEN